MVMIAEGIRKVVAYKKETTWGELAGATGGKVLRRVSANFNLTKDLYESNEIRTDYQRQDVRHGTRSVEGSLSGELSPGSYSDFFAAALARDFTIGSTALDISATIASSMSGYTVSRGAGSFLTDGFKVGDIVRLSGVGLSTANVGKNLLVTSVTALDLGVIVLNGTPLVAEGPISLVDVEVVGKKTFAPLTGHTDNSFTVEEFYSDIGRSEVSTGNKINTVSLTLPATGLTTVDFSFMGKDLTRTGTTQYFTSPAAQGTSGVFAAVNGALLVNGTVVALVTGLNVNINRNLTMEPVVGSNVVPDIFEGRIVVDGDFTAFFTDATFGDLFRNETEATLVVALTTSNMADADFVSIVLPRIKVNSDTKNDGEVGITSQHSFVALLNNNNTAYNQTTIAMQDSQAV